MELVRCVGVGFVVLDDGVAEDGRGVVVGEGGVNWGLEVERGVLAGGGALEGVSSELVEWLLVLLKEVCRFTFLAGLLAGEVGADLGREEDEALPAAAVGEGVFVPEETEDLRVRFFSGDRCFGLCCKGSIRPPDRLKCRASA